MDDGASRRAVLGGAALGMALTAAPGLAQGSGGGAAAAAPVPLRDPRTKYTAAPFPEQKQP